MSNKNNQLEKMDKKKEIKRKLRIWIRLAENEKMMSVAKDLINEMLDKLLAELRELKSTE